MNTKNLEEFLRALTQLNDANIDFMNQKQVNFNLHEKYKIELQQIADLINSFDLVRYKTFNK